jgi:predicted neuraminidase
MYVGRVTAWSHAEMISQLSLAADSETAYARLWTQCQRHVARACESVGLLPANGRCQGSLHQDVLCTVRMLGLGGAAR